MKISLILLALCACANALTISSRISNGQVAQNALHAVMVLVIRPELEGTGNAALGSGSIVSTRHVVTAAHVVRGNESGGSNRYQINFFTATSRRTLESNFAIVHENFNETNNANDIALIFVQGIGTFPVLNIIPLSTAAEQTTTTYTVTGFGFTSVDTIGSASVIAYSATQRVTLQCELENYEVSSSHFCAIDDVSSPAGIVCRGDNGAGLYITAEVDGNSVNTLVGIASHIAPGCETAVETAYTRASDFAVWVNSIIGV